VWYVVVTGDRDGAWGGWSVSGQGSVADGRIRTVVEFWRFAGWTVASVKPFRFSLSALDVDLETFFFKKRAARAVYFP
jgi:hypothetical protein